MLDGFYGCLEHVNRKMRDGIPCQYEATYQDDGLLVIFEKIASALRDRGGLIGDEVEPRAYVSSKMHEEFKQYFRDQPWRVASVGDVNHSLDRITYVDAGGVQWDIYLCEELKDLAVFTTQRKQVTINPFTKATEVNKAWLIAILKEKNDNNTSDT